MTTLLAAFRYELRMQFRKPSVWLTMAALAVLTALTPGNVNDVLSRSDPETAMVLAARLVMLLLPVGFGCLVADRLVRDERLNVRQLLDATPSGLGNRLTGKYFGACVATGVSVIGCYLLLAVAYVVRHGDPTALLYVPTVTVAVLVPALLFIGAFAMLCPLVMPAPLFRVLFVGYWFWTNLIDPTLLPTLNRTLINPLNGYVIDVFFAGTHSDLAGEVPGATLNLLRPAPTTVTAWLSLIVLLALAAAALAGARAVLARTAR
jgi:ABC-2 type transport system permease protein